MSRFYRVLHLLACAAILAFLAFAAIRAVNSDGIAKTYSSHRNE